nr:hypothetical protein [Tanacetum cinerariifolium]
MTTPTVTSSTDSQMHNNIMAAGSRHRPPMLATGRYPGPYKPTTVLVQAVAATDDSSAIPEHITVETPMNMSPANKAHFKAEKEVIHLILTGIRDEIYSTVDAFQIAQEMWEAIERLQQGKSLNIQDVKTNLFWEFGKFTSHDGETIESYYTRFYKLMNEMIRNNLTVATMQVSVLFRQQLQPEWSRFMTIVKQQHKLDERMNEAVKVAVQIQFDRLRDEAQRENEEFLKTIDENMKKIIKEQVKEQVKTSYAVAADLSKMELKKILIEKMEGNKSIRRSNEQRNLYKDEEPSAGPDRGSKRRREGKESKSVSAPTETDTRSAGRSTQGSRSRHASASVSALAEEPMQTTSQMEEPSYLEIDTGAEDQPIVQSSQHPEYTTLRHKNGNQSGQFGNQMTLNVAGARENVGRSVMQQSGIQCFNCKEFGHFAKKCRKPTRVKASAYHKEKMLMRKQAEKVDTDIDSEPLEKVQNDTGYNVFANDLQHSKQSESFSNTCLVETDDNNVISDSPDMCDDDIQNDQNDVESDDERVTLANLIANLKLDVDENKKTQKQLKKANTTLAQLIPGREETLALERERRSKLNKDSYVKSLETEIDELESDKAEFSNMYDMILQERVNHKTNVSRPQHRSNQLSDKVVPNNSHVKLKKTQVEEHPRISSISYKIKSVTACNDSLNSKTLNVNAVCATCKKCLVDSDHFACVTKKLNDVNARTKKPNVVPISTRKPKGHANKSVATPHKKKVASKSINQKPKSYYRMLYEKTSNAWKW